MRKLRVFLLSLVLGLAAPHCFAQDDLATTFDGQEVYFSAYWRLPGSMDQPFRPTVFHYDRSGGWSAIAHSDASWDVGEPFLSGNGSIVGWQRFAFMYPGGCPGCGTAQFTGLDPHSVKINAYALAISSNGRFLATPGDIMAYFPVLPAVQDLTTGQVWNLPVLSFPSFYAGAIANNGTMIGFRQVPNGYTVFQLHPGAASADFLTIPVNPLLQVSFDLALSADGKHAVVSSAQETGTCQINLVDLDSGSTQIIYQQDTCAWFSPARVSISADGSRQLFVAGSSTPQIVFLDRNTQTSTPLLGAPEGANEAIISGDGAVAWVSTTTNRLLRYDLNQGTRQEVLSEFPGFTHNLPYGVPGSAVRFNIGTPVAGEHFRSNGLEFPIVATNDISQTAVQAPWELSDRQKIPASGLVTLTIQKDGYPFELPEAFGPTNQITPLFEFLPRPAGAKYSPVKAASSDFSHLIDDAHPALPGETIVVWMTGLGPLDQTLATGAPGPSNPPAHTLAHLDCGMASTTGGPAWEGTLVPFVGYAPGLVGFYQVNITIPIDWPAGPALLDCYSGAQSSTGTIPVGASKL